MRGRTLLLSLLALVLLAAGCTGGGEGDGGEDAALPEPTEPVEVAQGEEDTPAPAGESLLDTVQSRGQLVCGVNNAVPGFGFVTEEGDFEGFDIEFCKVIAAAVLGDAEAVEFVPLTTEQRFTALQAGEIDVLVRNTTWTATRDGAEGAAFVTTTFYDGQTMMVRADSEFSSLDDMDNTAICVLSGTTTELNLATEFGARGLAYDPITFEDNEQLIEAFRQERCDGWTSDSSQLAGVRSAWPEADGGPESLVIFEERFSKEPLGPVVRDGDSRWFDAVNWAVIATMQAEEFEITSDNVDQMQQSEDPNILRFLGQPAAEDEAVLDPGLGLAPDFAVQVISQVGNYAEIYDRTVGADSPLGLERGLNALYTDGGVHYPPPYR